MSIYTYFLGVNLLFLIQGYIIVRDTLREKESRNSAYHTEVDRIAARRILK